MQYIELKLLEEEERERTTPIVAFDNGVMTQENADTFPILICRDSRYGQTGATCCAACSISFLVGFIKDLGLRGIIFKCVNKPSTKALPRCGDSRMCRSGRGSARTTRGDRVEMAPQCRTLRISAEHSTGVRIADDSPLLSWLPRLQRKSCTKWGLAKMERRVNWEELVEDGESQWRHLERRFGFVKLEKTVSVLLQAAWLTESLLLIMIEQEQFCALPRMELCVAQVGRDRHWAMLGNRRTGTACVALRGRWWLLNWIW